MSATMNSGDKSKWRRRKCSQSPEDDNDCASLAWLLNFRLDEIVNLKVPEDEPAVKEPKPAIPDTPPVPKKPPYTYPELIERALRENGELTVSAIYQWISDRFPFYKANDERWKNSVRHNLSINPHFRKGARAPQGAGHLWSLAANAIDLLPLRNHPVYIDEQTGETIQEAHIIECPKVIVLDEAAIAAASILPDQDFFSGSTSECNHKKEGLLTHEIMTVPHNKGQVKVIESPILCIRKHSTPDGVRVLNDDVFLNPVSTEQVVRECGLITVD